MKRSSLPTLAFTLIVIGLPILVIGATIGTAIGQIWIAGALIFVFLVLFALLPVIAQAVDKHVDLRDEAD